MKNLLKLTLISTGILITCSLYSQHQPQNQQGKPKGEQQQGNNPKTQTNSQVKPGPNNKTNSKEQQSQRGNQGDQETENSANQQRNKKNLNVDTTIGKLKSGGYNFR